MLISRVRLAVLVMFAFSCTWIGGRNDSLAADKSVTAQIDAIVAKAGITAQGPGAAVLVIQEGEVVYKKGYGLSVVKQGTPITPRTTFELASLSKPFCAMAILILYDRGQVSLTDDVRKFLPEVAEYNRRQPIRIVNLLQHTSGLPDYTELRDPRVGEIGYVDNGLYLKHLAGHKDDFEPTFLPGAKYEYSNTNYLLLAMALSGAVSTTWNIGTPGSGAASFSSRPPGSWPSPPPKPRMVN